MRQRLSFLFVALLVLILESTGNPQNHVALSVGTITANIALIRTGPTTNCEDVAKVLQGDGLMVRDERFGWVQVDLPPWSTAWIHQDLIRLEGMEESESEPRLLEDQAKPSLQEILRFGVVPGNRVNLRSRPGMNHTTLGQTGSGIRLRCTGRYGEWIRVQAPPGLRGWIQGDQISIHPLDLLCSELVDVLSDEKVYSFCGLCEKGGFLHHPIPGVFAQMDPESIWANHLGQWVWVAARYDLGDLPRGHPRLNVLAIQGWPTEEGNQP